MKEEMLIPEKMAKIQKSRTLSDAELLKDGAAYEFDEDGASRLDITESQEIQLKQKMGIEINKKRMLDDRLQKLLSGDMSKEEYEKSGWYSEAHVYIAEAAEKMGEISSLPKPELAWKLAAQSVKKELLETASDGSSYATIDTVKKAKQIFKKADMPADDIEDIDEILKKLEGGVVDELDIATVFNKYGW